MKFKAQVAGLLEAIEPIFYIATKGTVKDSSHANSITLHANSDGLELLADGGYVSGSNNATNEIYNFDYGCMAKGSATVHASDFHNALQSFVPTDIVTIAMNGESEGAELTITSSLDADEMQTVPVLPSHCKFTKSSPKNSKSQIKMRRDIFLNYASKIAFAHGDQMQFKMFKYWIIRAYNSENIRFAAGTGQIFAVVELTGSNIGTVSGNSNILIPNAQTPTILSVLNDAKTDDIQILLFDESIMIDSGNIKIKIVNFDPGIEWPDENKFLQRNSKYKFTTKVGNWKHAVKGIAATNNDEFRKQNRVHHCSLSIDLNKKLIQAKTNESSLKATRKIPIEDIGTDEELQELNLKCISKYFSDIIKEASDDDHLQFEIADNSSPVVVRYYAADDVMDYKNLIKKDDNGLQERYSVFFALAR